MAFIVLPGADASGNGNDWTANNINNTVSTATTYDIMTDVPTLTDEDTANYAVLNPLSAGPNANISQGNLYAVGNSVNHVGVYPTILPKTGKWYFEFYIVTANTGGFGFSNSPGPISGFPGLASGYWYIYGALTTGYSIHNELTYVSYTDTRFNTGNLGQMAIDFDTGKVWVGSNNVWINSTNGTTGNPSTGANPTWTMPTGVQYYPFMEFANPATTFAMNFGQRPFAYTPPTGYLKLNTFNLPDSSIVDGSENFVPVIWTANGSDQFISTGFDPDFVWYKARNQAYDHYLLDSLRSGALNSNNTDAEGGGGGSSNLGTGGFTINAGAASDTEVAWNWKAGGTAVSNTAGTITSSVSANPTAGFSIVTFTGTQTNQTVGHGLGVPPEIIITKPTVVQNWVVGATSIGWTKYLHLNLINAEGTSASPWNNTAPTSSVYSVGIAPDTNNNGNTMVAYCFASVEGYSKMGTYTGNGSADGPFVYTGFRPAFLMFKTTTIIGHWVIVDAERNTYNVVDNSLYPDTSGSEINTITDVDFLSNGFKWRGVLANETNVNGQVYIYMAFAENPFKNSLAR